MANGSIVTRRRGKIIAVVLVIALVLAAPILWYLGSPLFVNQVVSESLPPVSAGAGAAPAPSAPAAQPVPLSRGQFGEIDAIHKGEGAAVIYTLANGARVLRFEDFKVTNGPDLFVYLSPVAMPRDGRQVHDGGHELGRLKGNIGDQNHELPSDLDLSQFKSVVIYCKQFSVVFSTATLA